MKVLFVNHSQKECGVYQFGKRVFDLAKKSNKTIYTNYLETESREEFEAEIVASNPDIIIYNWYPITMPWLTEDMVVNDRIHKHVFLFHDGNLRQNFDMYLFSGSEGKDINLPKEKTAILPRPLFTYNGDYKVNDVPTIGSFGFGGWQKQFTELVRIVNYEFDNAVINIQMPFAYFGDRDGTETLKIADKCRELNTNPNVILNISHAFQTNEDTLRFLAGNDINVFLYKSQNQGLSSVIDYAISVKRPIAISYDSMFKHIYKPEICVDSNSISNIINNGTRALEEFYSNWNPEIFSDRMDEILNDL